MFTYIAQRILLFIPTIIIISLMAFLVSINAPADPVDRLVDTAQTEGGASTETSATKQVKQEIRKRYGLDLPVFYVSFTSLAVPDTLYKFVDKAQRENLGRLARKNGNWKKISTYFHALKKAEEAHSKLNVDSIYSSYYYTKLDTVYVLDTEGTINGMPADSFYASLEIPMRDSNYVIRQNQTRFRGLLDTVITNYVMEITNVKKPEFTKNQITDAKNNATIEYVTLMETSDYSVIDAKLDKLDSLYESFSFLVPLKETFTKVNLTYQEMRDHAQKWKIYVPTIKWYGAHCQYHVWLFGKDPWWKGATEAKGFFTKIFYPWARDMNVSKGILRADFGQSYADRQPVFDKIRNKFPYSFWLSVVSIFIAYIVSIPAGIYAAYKKDSFYDRASSFVFFLFYSMPTYFIGVLLLMLFANPDILSWFPSNGVKDASLWQESWSWWQKLNHQLPYFVLPLITYTIGSFAFLSRIMRVGMLEVISQDYIRTARAKGLGEQTVILKHALRNSLLPIITIFANIFPLAIGGSVIIETIFGIPGMGREIYNAILNYDYPMIIAVFTLIGALTMTGYLIADILYAWVDPRISFTKKAG